MTVDVFREDRTDIFQEKATIPSYLGVYGTKYYVNSAAVRNQGIDASIDFGHQFNKDFSMTFKGTFTYAHNEIRAYEESVGDRANLSRIGYSTSQQWGYVSDYLFADQTEINNHPTQLIGGTVGPGDIKYVNQPNVYGVYDDIIDKMTWYLLVIRLLLKLFMDLDPHFIIKVLIFLSSFRESLRLLCL